MSDAKATLKSAALQTLATRGIAGTSARTIADTAGLSQGLIFYHYGSVNGLLEAASTEIAEQRALAYRQRLATVTSLSDLAELARQLHDEEQQLGNVAVMAQLLAGAHTHPELAPVARANYDLLANEVRDTLHRLLADTALAAALPADHLAHAVSAAFIGIELLPDTDDADTSPELFETLGELARLVDSILDLGPQPPPHSAAGSPGANSDTEPDQQHGTRVIRRSRVPPARIALPRARRRAAAMRWAG